MKVLVVDDQPDVVRGILDGVNWSRLKIESAFGANSAAEAHNDGLQSINCTIEKFHKYKPPFCERHRWGYETLSLLFAFQFYSPSDKISFIKPTHYRTRGGEWRGCIAATSHKYMSSVIR